ncbi:MAG: hypothetical protein WC758_00745 [Candidatus Woesearchaeota archaeon]
MIEKLVKNIDWKGAQDYLVEIAPDFRKELFSVILKNFFSSSSSFLSIDNCVVDAERKGFSFFDKSGKSYICYENMDVNTSYVFFAWNKLTKKDREKLMYSKSQRKKIMKQDKEVTSIQSVPKIIKAQFIETDQFSEFAQQFAFGDDSYGIGPFGEGNYDEIIKKQETRYNDRLEKIKLEQKLVSGCHLETLEFEINNYPPRFSFSTSSEWGASFVKRKEMNEVLDELASRYNLRHSRGKYVYNKFKPRKDLEVVKSVEFKKSYRHMFKPYYVEFEKKRINC